MAGVPPEIAELVIQGSAGQEIRQKLIEGQTFRIGRAPTKGWAIHWDREISREHADLCWKDGRLSVVCLPGARNPIKWSGELRREISVGRSELFEIGQSRFSITGAALPRNARGAPSIQEELSNILLPSFNPANSPKIDFETHDVGNDSEDRSYQAGELKKASFGDTERQMEVLSNLPHMISNSPSDVELAVMLCGMLLEAIPPAIAVAVVMFEENDVDEIHRGDNLHTAMPRPKLMRVQTRSGFDGRFIPSRRLLRKALRHKDSVMHVVGDVSGAGAPFTMASTLGWAFCAPIVAPSCLGWCLYVSGEGGRVGNHVTEENLKGDLRFTQLVAQLIGSIRTVRTLQEQTTQLSAFFSPKVIANLTMKGGVGNAMAPSRREVTVLFCDVRGFSRKSEQLQDDLETFFNCAKSALSAMTGGILAFDGSIADFQGDAALGFWGWPTPLQDGPISACKAALMITQIFKLPRDEQDLLMGFSCGVGIAHGKAIAGQVGTTQQSKIGVFGPVVNQGSRLEGMTRMFGVDICVDETTADFVRELMSPTEGRVRRLGRVRPLGMESAIEVSELLPAETGCPQLTTDILFAHDQAVENVVGGRWDEAIEFLRLRANADGPAKFLIDQMALTNNLPPADWDGAFRMTSK